MQSGRYGSSIKTNTLASQLREVVFGMEDGMVSTLGAITGIAVGTQNPFVVILSGFVIIAVESISMGVGSYLSSKSEIDANKHRLKVEGSYDDLSSTSRRKTLEKLFREGGWSGALAKKMATEASTDSGLFVREIAYRKLGIIPESGGLPIRGGVYMWFFYVIGGFVPLAAYFFLPISDALYVSVPVSMLGLFALGIFTTRYTGRNWWRSGFEMFALASLAALIGYLVAVGVDLLFMG